MAPPDGGRGRVAAKLTLHLGVLVQNYRTPGKKSRSVTTGDVATFLESKYGVMAAYYRAHEKDVAKSLENSLSGAIESLVQGKAIDPWGSATQAIQSGFKDFIVSQEVERVGLAGVPTKAALRGVNHRLKHPYAKRNPRRPSFWDTHLYANSFRAWVD